MAEKKEFTGIAKVERIDHISGTDDAAYYTFKVWEKNGKKRIYVTDYQRRTIGYIDCDNENQIITDYSPRGGQYATIVKFMNEYNF